MTREQKLGVAIWGGMVARALGKRALVNPYPYCTQQRLGFFYGYYNQPWILKLWLNQPASRANYSVDFSIFRARGEAISKVSVRNPFS